MTTPNPILRASVGLAAAVALTLVAPSPAHAVAVSLGASRTSALPSTPVTFSGSAVGAPAGEPVTLQRRLGSGPWSTVTSGESVSSSETFSMSTYVAVGTYEYRAKVGASGYSTPTKVSGRYGRNIPIPAPGAPFTLSARLPRAWARVVKAQVSTNGTSWTDRGKSMSRSGLAGVRTYLPTTGYVRFVAPATGSLPKWAGPRGRVTIGTDPMIKKILDDTNAYRKLFGRGPLKLHPSLNRISGTWAYHMHQTCDYKHNPDYASGYPWGWRKAAENIAAGQSVLEVVAAWIASSTHRTNLLGDYTHIGIGYYQGAHCYKRYWVQNFAKY